MTGCDGQRPRYEYRYLPVKEMNVDVLRKDMQMIEKGINLSNTAKRENHVTSKAELD
jgi:hypothetical protein